MADSLIDRLDNPRIKKVFAYGSIGLGILDVLKTIAEFPETIQKDEKVIVIVGSFFWHLLKFPVEFIALFFCILLILLIGIPIVTLGIIDNEDEIVMMVLIAVALVIAVVLGVKYGVGGTFVLAGGAIHREWIKLSDPPYRNR